MHTHEDDRADRERKQSRHHTERVADSTGRAAVSHRLDAVDRTSVVGLQRAIGNSRVSSVLSSGIRTETPVNLQRSDWKFEPKIVTETDDSLDTDEKKEAARRKAEDERGESPTPRPWWKDQPPPAKPTDPKSMQDLQEMEGTNQPLQPWNGYRPDSARERTTAGRLSTHTGDRTGGRRIRLTALWGKRFCMIVLARAPAGRRPSGGSLRNDQHVG